MPVNYEALFEALVSLAEDKNLKVTVQNCVKGGLLTGFASLCGGLLFGPIGLAIGGTVGGIAAAVSTNKEFQPLSVVLKNMNESQRQLLHKKFKEAFEEFGVQDIATIVMLIMSQSSFQEIATKEVGKFLSKEMNLQLVKQ